MWQTIIKQFFLVSLIWLGWGWDAFAQLQPLKINIQLPAGVGLSSGSASGSGASNGNGTSSGKESGNEKSKDSKGKDSKGENGNEPIKGSTSLAQDQVEFAFISESGELVPLNWIRMQSMENSQFLVEFRNGEGNLLSTKCYFLNNSTDELQDASEISVFPALLQFNEEGRLIRNFSPRRTSLYSWIGLPKEQGMVTVIEYF